MKREVARLRLSPNEEARLLREECERRRKLRIQQVREQQRDIALHIRRDVEQRRQHELEQLEKDLKEDWERQQREKIDTLQKLYHESLQLLGQGHRRAKENEHDLAAIAQKEEENHTKAGVRYREALKELKSQKIKDQERQSRHIHARKMALQAEKERSAKVSSLPPPILNQLQNIDSKKPHVVKKCDVSAFAATHYHMSESTVDREVDPNQLNAHEEAELEMRRLQDLQREEKRRREEQLEKARLRGKLALRKEHLIQDREHFLVELEHMQQADLLRRRQNASKMPPQIFQPLCKRHETREDFQREMEFAFEDMHSGERKMKGDLMVQLDPEPLPAQSIGSQDQELDITLDEISTVETECTHGDTDQEASGTQQEESAQMDLSKPAPRQALKKLLDRIRSQRSSQWTEFKSYAPAVNSSTFITDQIPERDTTIDTGSLTSVERDKQSAMEPPEPTHASPDLEMTGQYTAMDTLHPDVPTERIYTFSEERKKTEEELEREKQRQVVLLMELEEQKATLEQVLLEAQKERETLKAALTQDVPINQPDVHDQEDASVTAGLFTELVSPPGEDDHSKKIREEQQRLLEQNRIHQRSVEVARQRLEEYQRALQIRYNMNITSMPPGVLPPRIFHAPPHSTPPTHSPTSLPLPTTPALLTYIPSQLQSSVEMPMRESDILPSSSHCPDYSFRDGSLLYQQKGEGPKMESERVIKHLPEMVRSVSITREQLYNKVLPTHPSTSLPLQQTSDSFQAISPTITDDASLVPGQVGNLPHGSVLTGCPGSRRNSKERQTLVLQQEHKSALERSQQDERKIMEMKQMRRQKETLQAPIPTDAKVSEVAVTAQYHIPERVGPCSFTREPLHNKLTPAQQSTVILLKQTPDPIQAIRPTLSYGTPPVPLPTMFKAGTLLCDSAVVESVGSRMDDIERQGQELQQLRKEREMDMEQMRRQKQTLQALIQTDSKPAPEAASDLSISENIRQPRLKLLASLLRAIEEANGGILSHLGDPQENDIHLQQLSFNNDETRPILQSNVLTGPSSAAVPTSGLFPPPRAAKPPVTRIRLGEMLTQHELSAIPEVETSVNTSQVTDNNLKVLSHIVDWDPPEECGSTIDSDKILQTPSGSSTGQQIDPSPNSSRTSSSCPGHFILKEKWLMGAGQSPESTESDSVVISQLSSDSGSGADYSGHAITLYTSFTESVHRPPDFACLSSTSISTGSYLTTDPEQNLNSGHETDLLNVSSPPDQSSGLKYRSSAACTAQAVDSLFNDCSIQRIIERYTKELNISLGTTGNPTDNGESDKMEPGHLESQQLLVRVSERREEDELFVICQSLPTDTSGTQRSVQESDDCVDPVLELFSSDDPSLAEGKEQDAFRPLCCQLTDQSSCQLTDQSSCQLKDQSSCLSSDHRDAAMEQLVGHPSAHSSMIGQIPSQPVSLGLAQGGWDSTLNQIIGRLSQQSSSQWLSGRQSFYTGQLMGQETFEQSTTWLDGGLEESQMRPLVGELDESAGQHGGGSGVSPEPHVPSYPEGSAHCAAVPSVKPHPENQTLQNKSSLMDQSTERNDGSDSFQPLLAEVTHNETAEPSVTFYLPDNMPHSPQGQSQCWDGSVATPSEGFEHHNDPSESELSPERLRKEELSRCDTASPELHESFSQLITSHCHPLESVLQVSPSVITEFPLTPQSNITMCDNATALKMPEEPFGAGDLTSEQESKLRNVTPVSKKILEAASEKGILEQSEITLVSLTDTSLQDRDTTKSEEGFCGDRHLDEMFESREKEKTECPLLQHQSPEKKTQPVILLESEWGPGEAVQEYHQQKCRVLFQSVEEIKALDGIRAPSGATEQSKAKDCPPRVNCKKKIKPNPQEKTNTKSNRGKGEHQQTTVKPGSIKQEKPKPAPSVSDAKLKRDEVKIFLVEERKRDLSEMHQRTLRLYEQLEEVKHQKAIRSRQEACARNRLRAKSFQQKTLEKLRAKQPLQ